MNKVKKDLLKEIDEKIARKKEVRANALANNNHQGFIMNFMKDMEDLTAGNVRADVWLTMAHICTNKLEDQMQTLDAGCKVEISWFREDGKEPQVNGVLIKWTPHYQSRNGVEPELFVDLTSLLF